MPLVRVVQGAGRTIREQEESLPAFRLIHQSNRLW